MIIDPEHFLRSFLGPSIWIRKSHSSTLNSPTQQAPMKYASLSGFRPCVIAEAAFKWQRCAGKGTALSHYSKRKSWKQSIKALDTTGDCRVTTMHPFWPFLENVQSSCTYWQPKEQWHCPSILDFCPILQLAQQKPPCRILWTEKLRSTFQMRPAVKAFWINFWTPCWKTKLHTWFEISQVFCHTQTEQYTHLPLRGKRLKAEVYKKKWHPPGEAPR